MCRPDAQCQWASSARSSCRADFSARRRLAQALWPACVQTMRTASSTPTWRSSKPPRTGLTVASVGHCGQRAVGGRWQCAHLDHARHLLRGAAEAQDGVAVRPGAQAAPARAALRIAPKLHAGRAQALRITLIDKAPIAVLIPGAGPA